MGVGAARALARQGAAVAVNDLHLDRAEAVAAQLAGEGFTAIASGFDVVDAEAVLAAATEIADRLGPVDILVNNAGVPTDMTPVPFRQMAPSQWRSYVDLNVYGSLNCIRAVLDGMCQRSWGRIVQVSSGAGRQGLAFGVSMYGAGKSGIEGFIRHLAMEVAAEGVTANAVALGLMDNVAGGDNAAVTALARSIPVRRLGAPDDLGAAVVFLASDEASFITGQTINVSGGSLQN
jgi:3-oxoacyl-[acyl-carrier protein] reductase